MTAVHPKVELHVHLDGAIRPETAWELLQKKNLTLPGDGSFKDFLNAISVKEPSSLQMFLHGFAIFLPAIVGDLDAIERMAYEFCDDKSRDGVIYAEVRYCPHLLMPHIFNHSPANYLGNAQKLSNSSNSEISLSDIVEAVNKGLVRGEKEFGIIVRSILSCIRGKPEWSNDILELCIKFQDQGVVGIDIAGDEGGTEEIVDSFAEEKMLDVEDIEVFTKAAEKGIHRTVHAGEAGPALMVWKALSVLKAERIGHGYRVLEDEKVYQHCLGTKVHFECCPMSSILTGSVALSKGEHPIVKFCRDQANFSISTDDPTVTLTTLSDEYNLLKKWGMTERDFQQSNINAIKSSFAEPEVQEAILKKLNSAYGVN